MISVFRGIRGLGGSKRGANDDTRILHQTPDPFKALCDTVRTTTNRVESGKVHYGVIEPDNLRLQKM
jgi:hypothetical protein